MIKTRSELINIFNEEKYKLGIEVGTYEGEFSKSILEQWNGTLYSLDVWRELGDDYSDVSNNVFPLEVLSNVFNNVNGFEDRSILIRASSEKGSSMFTDETFDFVYIDANHKYDYVKNDIDFWYSKVKKGGMMSGHDYIKNYRKEVTIDGFNTHVHLTSGKYCGLFGVNPAVDEFVKKYDLELNITTDEYFGSWYIFKP